MERGFKEFFLSTRVVIGRGSIHGIPDEFSRLKVEKILIVTDRGIEKAGILGIVKQSLEAKHRVFSVFSDVEPNPSIETVMKGYEFYNAEKCDGLLAVGGGSVIDAAKGVSVLATNGGNIQDYLGVNVYPNPPAPLIAVPTTVGTGSESSWASIVTLKEEKKKPAVCGWDLFPRVAFLDPQIVETLPPGLTAATGMDALTHAVEGYVALKSTPMTDALHRHAMSLIAQNLRAAVANGRNSDAMINMLVASNMAGMGISSSGVGLVHAMSYPLTTFFEVPHSEANAILLPHVMRFNWIASADKFAEMARLLGGQATSDTFKMARESADRVEELIRDVGMPSHLAEVGVDKGALEKMAEEVPQSVNTLNNPRPADFHEVVQLYRNAM